MGPRPRCAGDHVDNLWHWNQQEPFPIVKVIHYIAFARARWTHASKKLLSIEFEFESRVNRSTHAMIWSLPFPVFLAIGQSECDERLVEQANEFKKSGRIHSGLLEGMRLVYFQSSHEVAWCPLSNTRFQTV